MELSHNINWKQVEARLTAGFAQHGAGFPLIDTPVFPLAMHVAMPQGHAFENGHLGFALRQFSLGGTQDMCLDLDKCRVEGSRLHLGLRFNAVQVHGTYDVSAQMAPVINMDIGGNMLELDDDALLVAGEDEAGPRAELPPDTKAAMLDQARDQRTTLNQSQSGSELMRTFNEHNEAYNNAFVILPSLRTNWYAKGATQEMALDTHVAVDQDTVINATDKRYGTDQVTYNANSFLQQTFVATACAQLSKGKDDQYYKAAIAALGFSKAVNTTGNDKNNTVSMNKSEVYQTVDTSNGIPEVTHEEFRFFMNPGDEGGGDAQDQPQDWIKLDEEDRRLIRKAQYLFARDLAQRAENKPQTLWQGACTATLENAEAQVELVWETQGGLPTLHSTRVRLPGFSLDMDDTAWTGAAGDIARKRLSQIFFVRSLVHDQIETGFRRLIAQVLPQALAGI